MKYVIDINQTIEGDASECIVNAIACVDDDHWRNAPLVNVHRQLPTDGEPTLASVFQALPAIAADSDAARYRHLCEVDIPAWQYGYGDWFTIYLFSLMALADVQNYNRLAAVFPLEARAFRWWQTGNWDETPRPTAKETT